MTTIAEAIARAARELHSLGELPLLDAQLLMSCVLERERPWLLAHGEDVLPAYERTRFRRLVARRSQGVPVAYLIGSAGFYGREFRVHAGVLVPRPETEHVVEGALAEIDRLRASGAAPTVLDVGTGSGAIAVTIACERPNVSVVATDCSRGAVRLARANAARHGVSERVRVVESDLHHAAVGLGPFDVIVANLPYVPSADLPRAPESAACEPRLALDGGVDGLRLYGRLLPELPASLRAGGAVLLEAAPPTSRALARLAGGIFTGGEITIIADYGGRERVVRIRTESPAPREPGTMQRSSSTQSEPSSSHA